MNTYLSSGVKEKCCGCLACVYACPKKIIGISEDQGGFKYPFIENPTECIGCEKCRKVCPVDHEPTQQPTQLFALKSRDDSVRKESSSGGAFTVISDLLLEQGYKIYGCILDDDFRAIHIGSRNVENRDRMRKSKYVASDITGIFPSIKAELDDGERVCFSGTPCQVHALKLFLQKDYEGLFTIDFICHGVSSPNLFRDYVELCGGINEIKKVVFRDKEKYPWRTAEIKVYRKDNITSVHEKTYMKMFFRGFGFRSSCGVCHMATNKRPSDITIADFWSIHGFLPAMEDALGVSAVFVNNHKGADMIPGILENSISAEVDMQKALPSFLHMNQPEEGSLIDKYFWKCYSTWDKERFFKIFGGDSVCSKLIRKPREAVESIRRKIFLR